MRISDWSSDVCSSDLRIVVGLGEDGIVEIARIGAVDGDQRQVAQTLAAAEWRRGGGLGLGDGLLRKLAAEAVLVQRNEAERARVVALAEALQHAHAAQARSEEQTSEPQSLMRISCAV